MLHWSLIDFMRIPGNVDANLSMSPRMGSPSSDEVRVVVNDHQYRE